MSKYQLLQQIVNLLDDYESITSNKLQKTPVSFATFILENESFESNKLKIKNESIAQKNSRLQLEATPINIDTNISEVLVYMYRYAKLYTKKALQHSTLKTMDEFSYLATLLTFTKLTKIELINKSVQEKTTGIETINRLLASKFIKQIANPDDGRSQLLSITEKGKKELYSVFGDMSLVSQIVTGNLTSMEKSQLAFLLKKLDVYHNDIFLHKKESSLQELA